ARRIYNIYCPTMAGILSCRPSCGNPREGCRKILSCLSPQGAGAITMPAPVFPSRLFISAVSFAAILAGCAAPQPERRQEPATPVCSAVAADHPLVGSWLSVRRQSGVVGELKTLFVLRSDGTMAY